MATATLAGTHADNLSSTSEREVLKEEEGESEEGETFKKKLIPSKSKSKAKQWAADVETISLRYPKGSQ